MTAMLWTVVLHRTGAFVASALLLTLAAGCPAGESARCRDLCQHVVACVESLNQDDVVIDEAECTTTCTSLDRDPEGKATVDAYAACLRQASDCAAKLACKSAAATTPATTPAP